MRLQFTRKKQRKFANMRKTDTGDDAHVPAVVEEAHNGSHDDDLYNDNLEHHDSDDS